MSAVQTPDESRLVEALRAGDEAAFARLVDLYGASMLRVASLYVRNRSVAEEVVQETWLGVLRGIDRFERRSSLKSWIFRILTNTAKTRAVREGRTVPFSAFADAAADEGPSVDPARFLGPESKWHRHWAAPPVPWDEIPEAQLASKETLAKVSDAIAALPDGQRAVITLRDVEGLDSQEVCNLLDLSETNQRVLLHRARTKVRKALGEYLERE